MIEENCEPEILVDSILKRTCISIEFHYPQHEKPLLRCLLRLTLVIERTKVHLMSEHFVREKTKSASQRRR